MVRTAFLSCVLVLSVALPGQDTTADSLIALLRKHPRPDTVRVDLLLKAVGAVPVDQPDTAILLAREAMRLSKALHDTKRLGRSAESMAGIHDHNTNFDSAYYYHRLAVDAARECGDLTTLAWAWTGLAYVSVGATRTPGNSSRATMLAQAIAYTDSAIGVHRTLGDTTHLVYSLAQKAEALDYLHRTDEAYTALREAVGICEGRSDHKVVGVYGVMAEHFNAQKRYDSALVYSEIALRISEQDGFPPFIAFHRARIASELAQLGHFDRAIPLAKQALAYAQEHALEKEQLDAMYSLYEINKLAGRTQEALRWHELLLTSSDSTNAVMAREGMDKLQVQLEAVKDRERVTVLEKDRQINEQKRARQRMALFALGGGTLLLIMLALVIQNRYRLKRRALRHSEEQKAIIEKEKARSEELLLNILPEEVAEELKAKGSAEAVQIDQVTVLFTDFKGFTAMSEVLSPRDLVRDLNECFSAFDRITEKHGIEKIKTIGDAYMAAGGLPTPNTTHAQDVINAALEMRDFIAEGKARKVAAGLPYFEIRIGIHTGPVVAGIVGVKKFQYDIWGDTVNTASRMESSGEVGQVNISEATYALVRDAKEVRDGREVAAFAFTPRGKVQAKGKGEMEMYFVGQS